VKAIKTLPHASRGWWATAGVAGDTYTYLESPLKTVLIQVDYPLKVVVISVD
jgi:hypothetical protein